MEKFTLLPVLPENGGTVTHPGVTVPLENSLAFHMRTFNHARQTLPTIPTS